MKYKNGYKISCIKNSNADKVSPDDISKGALASKFRETADSIEKIRFYRFVATLNEIADFYKEEAIMKVA